MRETGRRWLWIGGLLLSLVTAHADSLKAKNGDVMLGRCVGIDRGLVVWETVYGDRVHVPFTAVLSLESSELWDWQLRGGERIRARWKVSDGMLVLNSATFGDLRCAVDQIDEAAPATEARGLSSEADPQEIAHLESTTVEGPPPPPAPTPPPESEAPPSSLQTLLRQSAVLLRPGEWSVSNGLTYSHDHALYSPVDARSLIFDQRIHRGITPRLELGLRWGAAQSVVKTVTVNEGTTAVRRTQELRALDPEFLASRQIVDEGRLAPECVIVAGVTVPVNRVGKGGFFRSRLGLQFLKTSDPGALFGGVEWLHDGDGWNRSPFQPVDHIGYRAGAAIGLNDELAVGFQAQGEYRATVRNRVGQLVALFTEPLSARFWFNLRLNQRSFLELAVTFPANDDAHAATWNATWIYRQ